MPASTHQTAVQNRNQPKKADPYPVCLFLKKGVFPLIDLLIKIFIKNHENTADRAVRTAYGNLACLVSVVCNLLLAGGKIAVGVLTGSVCVTTTFFSALTLTFWVLLAHSLGYIV